jgi:hypothetical protein
MVNKLRNTRRRAEKDVGPLKKILRSKDVCPVEKVQCICVP